MEYANLSDYANLITATCPKCKSTFVFKSSLTGRKLIQQFDISCIPVEEAVYLEGKEVKCSSCGYTSIVTSYVRITHTAMFLA